MTRSDEAELEWWRNFAAKFHPSELPQVGSMLLGRRWVITEATNDFYAPGDARSTDPSTSKRAAREITVSAKDARGKIALAFYKAQIIHKAGPLTSEAAVKLSGVSVSCPWKRVSDLKKIGVIAVDGERMGSKGRMVECYSITDHGCGVVASLFGDELHGEWVKSDA